MKSKVFLIIILGVVLLFAAGIYFFVLKKKGGETVSSIGKQEGALLPTSAPKLLVWDDQAGFTFQYPEGLIIDDHPEDDENYANIDFTSDDQTGGILVMASDTKYKNVDEWVKNDRTLKDGLVVDTTLGGKPAKKISFSDSGKVIVGAIDMQILFTFQMTDKENFWKPIFGQMLSTYEFVYPTAVPQKSSGSASDSSGEDIIEEEEIIE